jgi:hypothetical protein
MDKIREKISDNRIQKGEMQSLSNSDVETLKIELRAQMIKKISSSKDNAVAFLKKAGICDENGELSEIYR